MSIARSEKRSIIISGYYRTRLKGQAGATVHVRDAPRPGARRSSPPAKRFTGRSSAARARQANER